MPGTAARPLCLSAVRRRPAYLRWRAFRAGGGDAALAKIIAAFRVELLDKEPVLPSRRDDAADRSPMFRITPVECIRHAETGALFAVLRQTTDPQVADAIERLIDGARIATSTGSTCWIFRPGPGSTRST